MKKKKFFDAEFADALMNIRVSFLEEFFFNERKANKYIMVIFSILFVSLFFAFGVQTNKLEKRIVSLEQEIQRQECAKEAKSIGAGYTFIARESETECYPMYSD